MINLESSQISVSLKYLLPLGEYSSFKGLLEFKNTLAFIKAGDWERAANGMLASKWAKQVGMRAKSFLR
jgi:lysozyme